MDHSYNMVELPCKHRICPQCVEKQIFPTIDNEHIIIKCPWENCTSSMDFEVLKRKINSSTYDNIINSSPALFKYKKPPINSLELKEDVSPSTREKTIEDNHDLITPQKPTQTFELNEEVISMRIKNNAELLSPQNPIKTLEIKEEESKNSQEVFRSLNLQQKVTSNQTKHKINKAYFMSSNENIEEYDGEGLPGLIKNVKISPESSFDTYKKADEKNRLSSSIDLISNEGENKFLDHYQKGDIRNQLPRQNQRNQERLIKPPTTKMRENTFYCYYCHK